jgi:hypothetical protein
MEAWGGVMGGGGGCREAAAAIMRGTKWKEGGLGEIMKPEHF